MKGAPFSWGGGKRGGVSKLGGKASGCCEKWGEREQKRKGVTAEKKGKKTANVGREKKRGGNGVLGEGGGGGNYHGGGGGGFSIGKLLHSQGKGSSLVTKRESERKERGVRTKNRKSLPVLKKKKKEACPEK